VSSAGGADENVWQKLQHMHSLHARDDLNTVQSTSNLNIHGTRASVSSSVRADRSSSSSSSDSKYSGGMPESSTSELHMEGEGSALVADSGVRSGVILSNVKMEGIDNDFATAAGFCGPKSTRKAVESADYLLGIRMPRLVRDGDSSLLKALRERSEEAVLTAKSPFSSSSNVNHSCKKYSTSSSNSNSSSSCSGSSLRGNTGSRKDHPTKRSKSDTDAVGIGSPGKGVLRIGTRGRKYTDVWNEEDFLYKTRQESLLCTVSDWSSMMSSYSDTHDGAYREWSVHQTSLLMKKGPPRGHSEQTEFEMFAPPVPVATIHPSCWGLKAREKSQEIANEIKADNLSGGRGATEGLYEILHPASLSSTLVDLPGRCAEEGKLDDIDDMSLHAETLLRELRALETCNYLRLHSLEGYVWTASKLDGVRARRLQMEAVLSEMYHLNEFETLVSGRMTYSVKPTPVVPVPLLDSDMTYGDTQRDRPSDGAPSVFSKRPTR
jgi:hypothetical protein